MKRKTLYYLTFLLFTVLILTSGLYGNLIDANLYGDFVNSTDARDYSLGDSWVSADFNFSSQSEGWGIIYAPSALLTAESRSEYVFDSYDNTIGKQETAYSDNFFFKFPLNGSVYYRKGGIYLSAGWKPFINSEWEFEDIERDDYYQIVSHKRIESSFKIDGIYLGGSYKKGNLKFMLNTGLLRGEKSYYYKEDTSIIESSIDGTGFNLTGGISYDFNWRFRTVLKVSSGPRFNTDTLEYVYPYRLGAGVVVRPANRLPAVGIFEINYIPWSKMKVANQAQEDLEDIMIVSGGIEHRLKPGLKMRFGYRWSPSMLNRDISLSKFTGGVGFKKEGFSIDLGISYSLQSYSGTDINISGAGTLDDLIIEESGTQFLLTIKKMFEVK